LRAEIVPRRVRFRSDARGRCGPFFFLPPGLAVVFPVARSNRLSSDRGGVRNGFLFSIPQWPRMCRFHVRRRSSFLLSLLVRMRGMLLADGSRRIISNISRPDKLRFWRAWREVDCLLRLVIQQETFLLIRPRSCSSVTSCGVPASQWEYLCRILPSAGTAGFPDGSSGNPIWAFAADGIPRFSRWVCAAVERDQD